MPARQRHVSVFAAFALLDMDDHSLTVDITDFERAPFGEPEAAGVDGQQADRVNWETDAFEDMLNFLTCEDNGQPPFALWTDEVEGCPLLLASVCEEEFDAAKGNGNSSSFASFDILDM